MRPHWKWVVGFFITIALTSSTDAYFTYINKQFVDQGINLKDPAALMHLATIYGSSSCSRPSPSSRSCTWPACWANASSMTCAR